SSSDLAVVVVGHLRAFAQDDVREGRLLRDEVVDGHAQLGAQQSVQRHLERQQRRRGDRVDHQIPLRTVSATVSRNDDLATSAAGPAYGWADISEVPYSTYIEYVISSPGPTSRPEAPSWMRMASRRRPESTGASSCMTRFVSSAASRSALSAALPMSAASLVSWERSLPMPVMRTLEAISAPPFGRLGLDQLAVGPRVRLSHGRAPRTDDPVVLGELVVPQLVATQDVRVAVGVHHVGQLGRALHVTDLRAGERAFPQACRGDSDLQVVGVDARRQPPACPVGGRSEERRVGKECRDGWGRVN